ncbi:hypothetical protein NC651_040277 [Populus alba x Populus x berolinensis]|nr:hypothetical protein NC651_040277 [Populus alba x Populus x berolinensis]
MKPKNLLFSLFLFFTVTTAQTTIQPGTTLSAANPDQTWRSPTNTFYVGFSQVGSSSSYTLTINYNGGVPIWTAGNGTTTVDSKGSFQFLSSGNLRLLNGSGAVVWDSNTARLGATTASLDDFGNLVLLKNGTSVVWSSFDHPTDTIVPNQTFSVGQVLRSGSYSFRFLHTGNLTLRWNDTIEYWNKGLTSSVDGNLTSPTLGLQRTGGLTIFDAAFPSGSNIVAFSNDYDAGGVGWKFLRLGKDGNFRMYSTDIGSGNTTMVWSALTDQCEVFGYCGNMGICSYNERQGCRRKVEIESCGGTATMLVLDNAKFLTYQPETESQVFSNGISACRANCLSQSFCIASTSLSDGSGMCYLKNSGFISGYQSPALPSTSYVKVCGQAQPNPPPGLQVVLVVVVITLLGLIAVEGGLWWWCCRNSPKFGSLSAQYALLEYASGAPVQFSYKDLQRSTKEFKEKLGEGGFGAVYKGVLANRTVVAVKQLEGIEQGEKQFRMEVATISSTHHLNLVRLIGFCSEGRHRLLVYEFMKNGSLDHFLFTTEEQSGRLLNWEQRFNIALGTARGITYLHEECRDCIVHCDIKPENILVDENYNAKVSDFGLAKLITPKDHRYRTLTSVRGTRGYLAPEWLANLPITSKSDIYSYGMVLLEIVSGRRNFEVSAETNRKKFSAWAYEEFEKSNVTAILDQRLADQDVDMQQVTRAIQVSFWCIQDQPSQRPKMGKVVQMLEGISEIENPPAPKATTEGSIPGTSILSSSNVSALSTFAPSAPTPSSSSSYQTLEVSPLASGRNIERASSTLLHSDPN